jgi:hypothetical protein
MVEYGNGIGQVAGRSGSGGTGAGQLDVSASVGQFVHTASTLPPTVLAACVVAVFIGLFILRKAF